jgi:hypothetical protein
MDAFNKYIPADIPTMMIAGNHDMTEHPSRLHVHPYEMVWGQNYYHFWVGGHLFIALESQYFRSDEDATSELREQHIIWLETLLESVMEFIIFLVKIVFRLKINYRNLNATKIIRQTWS